MSLERRLKFHGIQRLTFLFQDNTGCHPFPILFIWKTDHRAFSHLRSLIKNFFNFSRINILATSDDHVFNTVNDVEVAVLIKYPNIATPQPISPENGPGFLWVIQVAFHHIGTTDADLPFLLRPQNITVWIPDLNLDNIDRCANGTNHMTNIMVVGDHRSSFSHSVGFVDIEVSSCLPLP